MSKSEQDSLEPIITIQPPPPAADVESDVEASEVELPPEVLQALEQLNIDEDYDPALENIRRKFSIRGLMRDAPSIAFSVAIHAAAIILLAVCYLPVIVDFRPDLTANIEDIDPMEDMEMFEDEPIEINVDDVDIPPIESDIEPMTEQMEINAEAPQMVVATSDIGNLMSADALISSMGGMESGGLGGRKNKGAGGLIGATEASEAAVAAGISWVSDHQLPNGSWCYTQLMNPNCRGKCQDTPVDKVEKSLISATAMAMLPMLGSGITHKEGKYRKEVKAGLDFMTKNCQLTPNGVIFSEKGIGSPMYNHGLSTIVICEAAAMTRDKNLEKLAQGAVNFICYAQDPVGGGWRYSPRQPGDTSGMGWNFMALKSAQMAYLNVPSNTIRGTQHFLNNVVGADGGAKYGYLNNGADDKEGMNRDIRGVTAIGLLGQMYMGWKADNPALIKGTDYLANWGPDVNNLYYSYYATQVMHHVGGEKWDVWNKKLRDALVEKQSRDGHAKGSYYATGGLVDRSGRLGATAFATMILEVYYRHLPLYKKTSTVDAFPLD
ncbi:MAG: prenyltransferase/squalene oxidase repeat-containing protein [Thermoguttaceae bacterium]